MLVTPELPEWDSIHKLRKEGWMVEIVEPNYETATAKCEHCGSICIFSRVDDLGTVDAVSGKRVECFSCKQQFWINADVLNEPYEFLIDDAREHFKIKRYMPAIASLGQAWEVFFAHFARGRYVYAPFFAVNRYDRDVNALNDLGNQLATVIGKFTFAPMRNLLIHTVARDIRPITMTDASTSIDRIKAEGFGNDPPGILLTQMVDTAIRELLAQTLALTVGALRNNVIHKGAYRPHRAEVEPCITDEIGVLRSLKRHLKVMGFMEHQMNGT
jgi:hypothetical protein